MQYLGSHSRGLLGIPDEVVVASGGAAPITWTVDADSGVAMPVDATEYADWIAANAWTSAPANPSSLFRCQEASGNLADSIGSRTLTKTGGGTFNYAADVTGWAANGVRAPSNSSSDWFSFSGNNLSTTAVVFFLITDLRTLATSRMLFSLGGSSSANATEVYHNVNGEIIAKRGGSTATSPSVYPNDVIGVLAAVRPASSSMAVYVKKVGGSLETLTPTWSAPPNASHTVYLSSGFSFGSSDAAQMRVEYWTGADAAAFDATMVAEFFTNRGF